MVEPFHVARRPSNFSRKETQGAQRSIRLFFSAFSALLSEPQTAQTDRAVGTAFLYSGMHDTVLKGFTDVFLADAHEDLGFLVIDPIHFTRGDQYFLA